jgi:hypothetical protein
MKNLFGEEFNSADYILHFEWSEPHLHISQGDPYTNTRGVEKCKRYCGTVSPNGWQGDSFNMQYALGEPVFTNFGTLSQISLRQMEVVVAEFNKNMPPIRAMQYVISKLANWKHISFDAAMAYVKEKGIQTIA